MSESDRTDRGSGDRGRSTAAARGRSRGSSRGGDRVMVPEADFTSYYGRPIVKAAPWERDIAYYLFTGGVAAGSSLLAGGADLTDRPGLRRAGRIGSLVALLAQRRRPGPRPRQAAAGSSTCCAWSKLTSPMSVGTWILSLHAPFAGLAAAAELRGHAAAPAGSAGRCACCCGSDVRPAWSGP